MNNFPGSDGSQLSGLHFAYEIPDLQRYDGGLEVLDLYVSGHVFRQTFYFKLATAQQPLI